MKFVNLLAVVLDLCYITLATASPTKLVKRTARTAPPSGCLTVRGSGTLSGEYSTLTAALAALGSATTAACIFIYTGTYNEGVTINYKGPLTLYGYTENTGIYNDNVVTIQRSLTSTAAGTLDASSTANIVSANFAAYNINFANTYGAGTQAVAVTANAEEIGFYACGFYGYQDTLYAKSGKQYYSNCYIEGAVDYAFGDASAWFGECVFASSGGGAITATSRSNATDGHWYVIDHSTVTSKTGVSLVGKVYLGRPWRQYSRVIFQNSVLTDVVNAAGWTTLYDGAIPTYEEYDNTGAGNNTSARLYETAATGAVSKDTLYGSGWKDWIDDSY